MSGGLLHEVDFFTRTKVSGYALSPHMETLMFAGLHLGSLPEATLYRPPGPLLLPLLAASVLLPASDADASLQGSNRRLV